MTERNDEEIMLQRNLINRAFESNFSGFFTSDNGYSVYSLILRTARYQTVFDLPDSTC